MTHDNRGHYSKKHPTDRPMDPAIKEAVRLEAEGGKLSCADAHRLAESRGFSPSDVGAAADMLEIRIVKCQMGLFGYKPEKRIVEPASDVPQDLENNIRSGVVKGKLPCRTAWEIARSRKISKMEVASACESLGIKISACQLGAF